MIAAKVATSLAQTFATLFVVVALSPFLSAQAATMFATALDPAQAAMMVDASLDPALAATVVAA